MKYQKSTLKIYEYLLKHSGRHLLESIIRETQVGRSSGFEAIHELANKRIIQISQEGRQKYLTLKINPVSLRFKLFLDELTLLSLPEETCFAINLFTELASEYKPEFILLIGSAASGTYKASSDIDFLIKTENRKAINNVRAKVESISPRIINTQFFTSNISKAMLLQAIPLYGLDNYLALVSAQYNENNASIDYAEALQWIMSAERDISKAGFKASLDNAANKLAFCYWKLKKEEQPNKLEARKFLSESFKSLNKKFKSNLDELNAIKEAAEKVGVEIYV